MPAKTPNRRSKTRTNVVFSFLFSTSPANEFPAKVFVEGVYLPTKHSVICHGWHCFVKNDNLDAVDPGPFAAPQFGVSALSQFEKHVEVLIKVNFLGDTS